jgi:hypothetical protein
MPDYALAIQEPGTLDLEHGSDEDVTYRIEFEAAASGWTFQVQRSTGTVWATVPHTMDGTTVVIAVTAATATGWKGTNMRWRLRRVTGGDGARDLYIGGWKVVDRLVARP